MEDRDSGQRTTALVTAFWRAPWISCSFVQPAIVWFGGARPHKPPQRHPLPLCAHDGGGGGPVGVWWCDHGQCWGSMLWQWSQEVEDTGADENRRGHGCQRSKRRGNRGKREQMEAGRGDARLMYERCKGVTLAMQRTPWALPWQPHGPGADLRWKGRREEENNARVQCDQLLHRTGLAH